MDIKTCYEEVKRHFPDLKEKFDLVQSVDEHRNFWKPDKVKVVLLAESHVFLEQSCRINKTQLHSSIQNTIPPNYAGVIYCLAYGEPDLLTHDSCKRVGTPQFWKIFYAAINQVKSDEDFSPILKRGTKEFEKRIANKIEVLEKMKQKGVWLLDASILALYPKSIFSNKERMEILLICWRSHVQHIIARENPKKIIVIGMDVARILENQLEMLGIPFQKIKQPQGYRGPGSTQERFGDYNILYNEVENAHSST